MSVEINLRRTPLYDRHRAARARMVPFAGFEMPVQYAGVFREHEAVRKRAGLFDLSHMGQIMLHGPGVGPWADQLTVNHVATMQQGQARYNLFCNEYGGVHDDVIFYRVTDDDWLLVVNASNARKMWTLLNAHRHPEVKIENHHGAAALIAIQGPLSAQILAPLVGDADRAHVEAMKYYSCMETSVAQIDVLLARTGYTGEDGFELFARYDKAESLWDALMAAGEPQGLEMCGLGARDVLRLEAGMPLYGHELEEEITPLQAGLEWAVKFDKPEFEGKEALEEQRAEGDYPRVAGYVLEGRAPPPRPGYRVYFDGGDVGEVCSGGPGPSVGAPIGTAIVQREAAEIGAKIWIEVRENRWPATVVKLPFYKRRGH